MAVDVDLPGGVPEPLGVLIARIDRAVAELAEGTRQREAMHTLRSGLSDIFALTEQDPRIERAIERVVKAGDLLAEGAGITSHPRRTQARTTRLNATRRALARLDNTLVDARPSHIAVSLGRGW